MANPNMKEHWVDYVLNKMSVVRFCGTVFSLATSPAKVVSRRDIADCIYAANKSIKKSVIDDVWDSVQSVSPDYSQYRHLICFNARSQQPKLWDTNKLEFVDFQMEYVYSTDIELTDKTAKPKKFLLELAGGNQLLANDYLQAIAPLFMGRRPAGAIWFVGNGANGKSALVKALYRALGNYFSSLTLSAIEDGRALPALRGKLGNIVRESSEARVEDSEAYKAISTHEPLTIRLMRTNETVDVDTDMHTIFNANNIPVFADKTLGARRRTLVVPFPAHFEDDPTFEDRTFTPEFLGGLLQLVLEATHIIRDNGYKYKWSDATLRAKESYDSEVNSAEAFYTHLRDSGIVGFTNYQMLRLNYENWCGKEGLVPLGQTLLKRTMTNDGKAEKRTIREPNSDKTHRYFLLSGAPLPADITWLDIGYGIGKREEVEQGQEAPKSGW